MNPIDVLTLAADRGDLLDLQALLDRQPGPARLTLLRDHANPAVVGAVLTHQLQAQAHPEWRCCLPTVLTPYPPRVQQLAARATLRLMPSTDSLPAWQGIVDPHTHAWWAAVALCTGAESPLQGEAILQALQHVHAAQAVDPLALIDQLIHRQSPALHTAIARLITEAAGEGRVEPAALSARIGPLLQSPDPDACTAAKALLEAGWARLGPAPTEALQSALAAGIDVVSTATAWHQPALLNEVFTDTNRPTPMRRAALAAIGQIGGRADLDAAIQSAGEAAPHLGAALATTLSAFHARGLFIRAPQLAPTLRVFFQTPAWTPQAFASICYTVRKPLIALLSATAVDHPHARRIAPILAHLPIPALDLMRDLLASRCPETRTATLEAVGEGRWIALEADVLELLPEHPESALKTLRIIGGPATGDALQAALGLTGQPMCAWARHDRAQALTLAWLTSDEAQLLSRLDAASTSGVPIELHLYPLPQPIQSRIGQQLAPAALRLLSAETTRRISADEPRAVIEWIEALAQRADPKVTPLLGQLLVRHVRDAVRGDTLPPADPWEYRAPGHSEPRISARVSAAIIQLGQSLGAQALAPPRPTDSTPGHALLAQLLLRQLPDPAAAVETLILTELTALDAPWISAATQAYHRDDTPSTRRQAIRCITQQRARGLVFNITVLANNRDPITARAALDALVEFQPPGASPAFIAALGHANMNVRRTATRALAALPSPAAVPALLRWLHQHSNLGFRRDLLAALDATVGRGMRRHLLSAALTQTDDPAARERLQAILAPQRPTGSPAPAEPTRVDPQQAQLALRDLGALEHSDTFTESPERALRLIRSAPPTRADAALLQFAQLQPALSLRAVRAHLPWLITQIPLRTDGRPVAATAQLTIEAARWMDLLPIGEQITRTEQLRATPGLWPTVRLRWLTALSASITARDLHAAIADCAQSPGPEQARRAVLRRVYPEQDDHPELKTLIARCVQDPTVLDTLTALQPPGGTWPLSAAHQTRVEQATLRAQRQRISGEAQHALHLSELRGPDRAASNAAAAILLDGVDEAARQEVLQRWLENQLPDLPANVPLAQLALGIPWHPQHAGRLLTLCPLLEPSALTPHTRWLMEQHAHGQPGAQATLQRLDPERLLTCALALADDGGPLYAPPAAGLRDSNALRALLEHLRRANRPELHDLKQRCHPPTQPSPEQLARTHLALPPAAGVDDWLHTLETGDRDACLIALRALRPHATPAVASAVQAACDHAEPRVQAAAWRCLRDVAPQSAYLEVSRARLQATNLGVRRQAARALAYARDPESARALVALLDHRDRALREAAEVGVKNLGPLASAELHRALRRARPDQRAAFQALIDDQP